jgi:alpha-L-rhamnosidase
MLERLRRWAPSLHRSGPVGKLLTRRLRIGAAAVLPLALVGLTLTAASAPAAQSSRQVAQPSSSAPVVGSLTTENMTDPLGIDSSQPQLGWVITSAARGVSQSKYEIRVAEDENDLVNGQNLVWDSQIVNSSQSFNITYGGQALTSRTRYYWQVRVWDNYGNASAWSAPAWFETAFLDPSQFQGDWIGDPDPLSLNGANWIWYPEGNPAQSAPVATRYFRREVTVPTTPALDRATFLITADDQFVLYVNGQEVARSSGQADAWQQAQEVNVTSELHAGSNTIAVAATNAGGPGSWIGNLGLEFSDGTTTNVVTDNSWLSSTVGPQGWQDPGFDDSAWVPALESAAYGGGPWGTNVNAGGELLLRKQFALDSRAITGARLYVSGLSYPYMYINGKPVSNHVLDTAFTEYGASTYWTVQQGSLHIAGGDTAGILKEGSDWTDYTMAFNTSIDSYQSGWVVRAQSADTNYLLILDTNDDTVGPKDSLQEVVDQDGSYYTISDVALPFAVSDGTWYAVKTVVSGSSVTTSVNGTQVASFDSSNLPSGTQPITAGTIGFREDSGTEEQANFDDLSVTSPSGATLFSSPLNQASDLSAFATPGTSGASVDYTTYDVTKLVHSASNMIAVSLGQGFYAGGADDYPTSGEPWQPAQPKLKLELDVQYANGASTQVVSDPTWQVSTGPTTFNSPAAETYDDLVADPGWMNPGDNSNGWVGAATLPAPDAVLRAQLIPPVEETATIKPVSVTQPLPDTNVYDFGITTSGWTRITMKGAPGTTVDIIYSEKLNSDGTVQSEGNGSYGQVDTYTLNGSGPQTYEPKYGWKGYQYVEVTTDSCPSGVPAPCTQPLPTIMSIKGVVVHTALPTSGNFHSSSALLNSMNTAMRNTILNNQYSYGSDTPVYEKGGWTNDNGDYSTAEMDNFGAESYYDHMMQNFDDSQDGAGNIGIMVPTPPGDDAVDPLWGGSFLLIEYNMFENYDNLAIVQRDYSHMAAYVDDMASLIAPTGYIYQGTTYGDWSVPSNANPPSSEMLGSMFIYREAADLATMAAAIGNTAGATEYNNLAATIRTAVNDEFYDSTDNAYRDPLGLDSHAYGGPNGTITSSAYDQTANAIGLAFGLAPDADRQAVADGLAANVIAQGNHLATGANGSKYILPMLSEAGYGDLAYEVATNPTAPGWGQWFLQCHVTTMWEAWEDSSCNTARSHDHAFMGTVDDWLYANVAGIQSTSPGFRTVQIDPSAVDDLTSASAYETTPLGRVSSSWTRSGTSFALTAQVPVGSQASVCIPAASAQSVTESGNPIGSASGVTVVGMQGSCLQVQVGSGTYRFRSTMS